MKTKLIILFIILAEIFISCKSQDEMIKDVVDNFLTECNTKDKTSNNFVRFVTEDYYHHIRDKRYYTIQNWELRIIQEESKKDSENSMIVVEATGTANDEQGKPLNIIQKFSLINDSGQWKIDDSYGFRIIKLNFNIADAQWDFYWDKEKDEIFGELQRKIEMMEEDAEKFAEIISTMTLFDISTYLIYGQAYQDKYKSDDFIKFMSEVKSKIMKRSQNGEEVGMWGEMFVLGNNILHLGLD